MLTQLHSFVNILHSSGWLACTDIYTQKPTNRCMEYWTTTEKNYWKCVFFPNFLINLLSQYDTKTESYKFPADDKSWQHNRGLPSFKKSCDQENVILYSWKHAHSRNDVMLRFCLTHICLFHDVIVQDLLFHLFHITSILYHSWKLISDTSFQICKTGNGVPKNIGFGFTGDYFQSSSSGKHERFWLHFGTLYPVSLDL